MAPSHLIRPEKNPSTGYIIEARKILAAYPYLRAEYEPKIATTLRKLARADDYA